MHPKRPYMNPFNMELREKFQNISSRVDERKSKSFTKLNTSKQQRLSSAPSSSIMFFPAEECLFCNKKTIKVKSVLQMLTKCVTDVCKKFRQLLKREKKRDLLFKKLNGP